MEPSTQPKPSWEVAAIDLVKVTAYKDDFYDPKSSSLLVVRTIQIMPYSKDADTINARLDCVEELTQHEV
jgi:hypothetical protein